MRLFASLLVVSLLCAGSAAAAQSGLIEPTLHVGAGGQASPRVALTFDACSGKTDMRILSALVDNRIPATIFVTGRWLKRNRLAFAQMQAHPDLFEIENHGARHIPAVDRPLRVYGIAAAGSSAALDAEVEGGAQAIRDAGGSNPRWFRGATARYNQTAIAQIRKLGFKVAGYSVNGDWGALAGAKTAEKQVSGAHDGDVVIAHINQPTHAAGAGVVKGMLDLKSKGFSFVRLSDATTSGSDGTTDAEPATF